MHLFQNAAQRFRYYYNTYRPFERDATLRAGQGELVYLDDYIMGWLVFGDGIEACGKDFSVLMQVHSALLIDMMWCSAILNHPDYWEGDGGTVISMSSLEDDKQPRRRVPHPISALGTSSPGTQGAEYDDRECEAIFEHQGPIHPAFLREWFDYLAALAPNARKDEWLSLWEARNEAVVTPE